MHYSVIAEQFGDWFLQEKNLTQREAVLLSGKLDRVTNGGTFLVLTDEEAVRVIEGKEDPYQL